MAYPGESRQERAAAPAILRKLPVKFSSTILGGTKKKKRPIWALSHFFSSAMRRA